MGSHKGDSPVDTQAVSIESSRKGVKSKVVRLHKGSGRVDCSSNTDESGNESSQYSSASEPERVVKSHKGSSLVDTTSGRQSSSHWDNSALGSRRPPPRNECSPSGSPRSWQRFEADWEDLPGKVHVTHHGGSHDPDIQQSIRAYRNQPVSPPHG